ncbi:DNA breaking-rejoining enzyme [Suillus discolor]|uniref:DNA breaking-rejoining enzyme n=1 Tax=Suillus discolor TaxID=1912936 RepID=A0A9P7FDX1_9AGAM|nr:DNA breaking-rejoining enzyme [Suillus discolor]KAG2115288.1 DNA breaking-rejoining enzyme [Suillus discolor]
MLIDQRSDFLNIDGTTKPSTQDCGTYSHVQKMYVGGGLMIGNPSISIEVSSYMCSLHRSGEVANSAYAIMSDILLKPTKMEVHDASNLKHLCCSTHSDCPVEIKPFHLWSLPSCEAHICPVRALAAWLSESKITSGYLFQKIVSGDCIAEANSPISSEQFLKLFHNNLLDINVDPTPYGTHSFQRWEGWSVEFFNLTIVKYLISSNDDPIEPREHFFDPNRPPMVKCPQCRRCWACA